jgi:hypothetical protein
MKMYGTILAIALAAVPLGGMAAANAPTIPQLQNHSLKTKAVQKVQQSPFLPLSDGKAVALDRVGKMSSQPWTEIVGWHQGQSKFVTTETAEPKLVLFSFKF